MEPCNPEYAHAGPYGEELAGWLTLLVGRGKRRFEKGFPGGSAVCVQRRHQPLHETDVFTSRRQLPHKVMHGCSL
jgi:hypothetical protein